MTKTVSKANASGLSPLLIDAAKSRLLVLFAIAQTRLAQRFKAAVLRQLKCPAIAFNQRGKVAASAVLRKNMIKLNRTLYSDNQDYFINEVIAHELAHILVFQIFTLQGKPVKPHGIEWRNMMINIFEIPANVTHQLDVSKVAMQSFTYACSCQQIQLSIVRHNKVLRGKQNYLCRRCNSALAYQASVNLNNAI